MTLLSFILFAWLLNFYPPTSLSVLDTNHKQQPPQVKTHGATFIGKTDDYYGVDTFLGIRYAQPPIGSLRLQPPQKVGNDGTINATSFGAQCFQLSTPANATNNISEDCLYLNIYKPSAAALKEHCEDDDDDEDGRSMPVMFFIHGGAFNDGSGESYDARSLVNMSVALGTPTIVVTINYRLSFFGFSGIYLFMLLSLKHPSVKYIQFLTTPFRSRNNSYSRQCPQPRPSGPALRPPLDPLQHPLFRRLPIQSSSLGPLRRRRLRWPPDHRLQRHRRPPKPFPRRNLAIWLPASPRPDAPCDIPALPAGMGLSRSGH
jgi:hypothetical protein